MKRSRRWIIVSAVFAPAALAIALVQLAAAWLVVGCDWCGERLSQAHRRLVRAPEKRP